MALTFYRLTQSLLAPGARAAIAGRIEHRPGRALDVGCGPSSLLRYVSMDPVGVDLDPARARAFGKAIVATAATLPFVNGAFDSVWSFGLLHHLPDDAARTAIREMRRVTCDGGLTVIFDGVLPANSRPLARLIRNLDRGGFMRTHASLDRLFDGSGEWTRQQFTYTGTGLEGVLYQHASG